jgi:tRNA nucleotidyltransferase (CCA-adding enzyme)
MPETAGDPLMHERIAESIAELGGRAWFAGGCVRDLLLGRDPLDFDIEVYGLSLDELETCLEKFGEVHAVGRSFGVLKFRSAEGVEVDFSLPRRENREGRGHRGFVVDLDPGISQEEACSRRDFTINAMLRDVLSGEIRDYFGGQDDLKAGILRHVGPAFEEDPLRVYRLMQFAARFDMEAVPETLELCRRMDLSELAPERVFEEFAKLMLLSKRPSRGWRVAEEAGILDYHPELLALVGCPQDPHWHPEGDVWVHTLMTVDAAVESRNGERFHDLALMFGALCHDLGKPSTTFPREDGRIVSPGHCESGAPLARQFMERICNSKELIESVERFTLLHLRPMQLYQARKKVGPGAIRRLALLVNIKELLEIARADHYGRSTKDALELDFPAGKWLLDIAEDLKVQEQAAEPLLLGRHLLEQGFTPGLEMGKVLKEAYEAQIEGDFEDLEGALQWLKERKPDE